MSGLRLLYSGTHTYVCSQIQRYIAFACMHIAGKYVIKAAALKIKDNGTLHIHIYLPVASMPESILH